MYGMYVTYARYVRRAYDVLCCVMSVCSACVCEVGR